MNQTLSISQKWLLSKAPVTVWNTIDFVASALIVAFSMPCWSLSPTVLKHCFSVTSVKLYSAIPLLRNTKRVFVLRSLSFKSLFQPTALHKLHDTTSNGALDTSYC